MTDALARAVMSGSVEAVERLIKQGNVDLNRTDKKGRTPLYLAAFNGQATLLKFLLTAGADPNIVDKFGQRYENFKILG